MNVFMTDVVPWHFLSYSRQVYLDVTKLLSIFTGIL